MVNEGKDVTIIATGFEQNIMKGDKTESQKIMVGIDEDMGIAIKGADKDDDFEITNERTVEFEPVIKAPEPTIEKTKHNYNEPYVRPEETEKREEIRRTLREKEASRKTEEATPSMNINPSRMQNSEWIAEMTKVPAFARRKVQLDDVAPASEMKMSRLTVTDDEGDDMIKGNTYLYDKPC